MLARWTRIIFLLGMLLCMCQVAAYADELPAIYNETYIDWGVGDTVNVAGVISVTVTEANRCSYSEFLESINNPEDDTEGEYPAHCVVVQSTIMNTCDKEISGEEIASYVTPSYFQYPFSEEEELNPDEYVGWVSCDMFLRTERNYARYELNTDYDTIKVHKAGMSFEEMPDIQDVVLKPGESLEIIDVNGYVNEGRHQAFLSPLAYRVSIDDEKVLILLEDLSIDLNTDEYVDTPMNLLDLYLDDIVCASDEDIRYKYLYRWVELKGTERLCEQLKICQEIFGLEPTGIVDQHTVNQLIHYNNKHYQ